MSNRFAFVLVAAIFLVPCSAVITAAEESPADAKQGCCDKDKGCCDKDKKCDQDSQCTACKCKDCKNADCDMENCTCEGCENSDCKCSATACKGCDKSSCHRDASDYASCGKGDCGDRACDALSACAANGDCKSASNSALRMSGYSLFDIASPSPAIADEMWQFIAAELDLTPRDCAATATTPSPQSKAVYLILDAESGGDCALRADCGEETTVSSVLRGAILPHPVDFAAAEIAVHRACQVQDGATIEMEERILPVRWDQAVGKPTKCTNHSLQAGDRICVKLAAAAEGAPGTDAVESPATSAMTIRDFINQPRQESIEANATQIQYSIQVIEDRRGCMSEYDALRRGVPVMFAETKTLLPAMRMLEKHQLVRQLSSPKIICTAGQTAQLEFGETESGPEMRLEVSAEKFEDGLQIELAMQTNQEQHEFERRTELVVGRGQSIVLNATPLQARPSDPEADEAPAVYVVLTPEIVE
jgi:hypothetical protein